MIDIKRKNDEGCLDAETLVKEAPPKLAKPEGMDKRRLDWQPALRSLDEVGASFFYGIIFIKF
jgi:hypothetical protein